MNDRSCINHHARCQYGWATFFAILLVCLTFPLHASQRMALVIGNGAYQHDRVLPNPRNDADGMTQVLRRLGFEVTQGKDLGKSAMERTVLEFGRKAGGADIALVYFAGHGLEVGGKNYLLPVDASLPDELALRTEAVDLELILEAVAPARTRLLFLDACRNNPLANNMRLRTAGRSVGRGLGRVDAVSNTLIAFATAPGTVAADGDGSNSPFAAALITHLDKPGLEIQQVMREVRRSVAQATRNQQVPWESSQLFDAVVLRPGAGTPVASVVPEPVRPMQPQPASVTVPAPPARQKVTYAAEVFFPSDTSSLSAEISAKLTDLAQRAKSVNLEVVIAVGHADSREAQRSRVAGQALSDRRAESVKTYLVGQGIAPNRIYVEGKGSDQPVADNATESGRAKNRRVELEVVGTR